MQIPFFRPELNEEAVREVLDTLRCGWLTSGPKVHRFEQEFAAAVGATHAVAVNSCTAALHLAVEALRLGPGQAVLVPTMTFAATAEVVRYQGAVPILVDCNPVTLNMDLADAERKLLALKSGRPPAGVPEGLEAVGVIPVHVGGQMMNASEVRLFAERHGLWLVEDAAHAFPAAWRPTAADAWQMCGQRTADATCFSFYANKTITTGEGGMLVTEDGDLADRVRLMSLHGLSHDAWGRYAKGGKWDYQIIAPGYKYNLTDIAASIGIHELARAEEGRSRREAIARRYFDAFAGIEEFELPAENPDRIHAWHLFPIKLNLERLSLDRNAFMEELKEAGVMCSVHWRPLHLHPYYVEKFGWRPDDLPVATATWERVVSLPLFPAMREDEIDYVIRVVRETAGRRALRRIPSSGAERVTTGRLTEGHGKSSAGYQTI